MTRRARDTVPAAPVTDDEAIADLRSRATRQTVLCGWCVNRDRYPAHRACSDYRCECACRKPCGHTLCSLAGGPCRVTG